MSDQPERMEPVTVMLPYETFIRVCNLAGRTIKSPEEFVRTAVYTAIEKSEGEERSGARISGSIDAFTSAFTGGKTR